LLKARGIWFIGAPVMLLLLSACVGSRSAFTPQPISVATALHPCTSGYGTWQVRTVVGYVRHGAVLNGPTAFIGVLFDSNAVPEDAGETQAIIAYDHGWEFGVGDEQPLARDPVLQHIRDRDRLLVTGLSICEGGHLLFQLTSIGIAQTV
jgi:hypothetical protein